MFWFSEENLFRFNISNFEWVSVIFMRERERESERERERERRERERERREREE